MLTYFGQRSHARKREWAYEDAIQMPQWFSEYSFEVLKFQHVSVLDGIVRADGILRLRHYALGQHGGYVFGQGGALVKLAADMAVKLAHAPAAMQGLSFIEVAGTVVFDGLQTHIGRPWQGEGVSQFRPAQLRRRSLRFLC
jgi:hypothetical protein